MKKTSDQVEEVRITLDTVLGLAQTINDLLEENISMLFEYPSADEGEKWQAKRLANKLLALATATINTTEKAQNQVELVEKKTIKDGEK
ncbi:hypothetical protein DKZ34_04750 [Limosilactobacillus reuteri]|uniref:hypothetical protein n=1 Tax=Limosilactobacillus reuteri TaxID=1598 RepID=UPI000D6ED91E|nr:hypothetical protein [Limosilactobacillus reuteri]PWT40852.1 hypothetical protein DKZ34_04750 [Limosilactobacillus reuteri]